MLHSFLFQGGFRSNHSTETADWVLLSLSAAFDTMERDILIQRLHGSVGLTGGLMVDLRGFCVSNSGLIFAQIKNSIRCSSRLDPLGPLLFNIYMLPLGTVRKNHNISYSSCAHNTYQFSSDDLTSIQKLMSYTDGINHWIIHNFLELNRLKTETFAVGAKKSETEYLSLPFLKLSGFSEEGQR